MPITRWKWSRMEQCGRNGRNMTGRRRTLSRQQSSCRSGSGWLPPLTESDKALAAESRVLREKEFIQLKKDRVIIHTGHLAGKLLVDVLMADLMENTDSIQSPALAAAA